MHDTYWKGNLQRLILPDETPKGMKTILIEKCIDVRGMKLEDMRKELASHPDFQDEQPEIANFLKRKGNACLFLPSSIVSLIP